jgi:hypothetical protein
MRWAKSAPLVVIGLTDLPNSGLAKAHPDHPLAASLRYSSPILLNFNLWKTSNLKDYFVTVEYIDKIIFSCKKNVEEFASCSGIQYVVVMGLPTQIIGLWKVKNARKNLIWQLLIKENVKNMWYQNLWRVSNVTITHKSIDAFFSLQKECIYNISNLKGLEINKKL